MLTVSRANALASAINDAFGAIGCVGESKMPRSKRNTEPTAWEYFVASHLLRRADARREAAHKAAVKLGVMFDHQADPRPVGTEALIYAGDVVEIALSVTTPGTRLDATKLGVELVRKAGVPIEMVERLFRECTVTNAAPHKFVSTLITR